MKSHMKDHAEGTVEKLTGKNEEKIGQVNRARAGRAAYHTPASIWILGCGRMIHHNQDFDRHNVFGIKEFKSNLDNMRGQF